jgi:hypothetical protein
MGQETICEDGFCHYIDLPVDRACGAFCQFEWLEFSSNFFSLSVYTPAVLAGAAIFYLVKVIKKRKEKEDKK